MGDAQATPGSVHTVVLTELDVAAQVAQGPIRYRPPTWERPWKR